MKSFIIRRLLFSILVVFVVSVVVFLMLPLTGDPVDLMLSIGVSDELREAMRSRLGLDEPLYRQFLMFLRNTYLRRDFGYSFRFRTPAMPLVLSRFRATIELALSAMTLSILISVPAGIIAAIKKDSWIDNIVRIFVLFGQGAPTFWTGLIFIMIFSVRLGYFPVSGRSGFLSLVLPSLTIGLFISALFVRIIREELIEVLSKDYIRTAKSKGLFVRTVLFKHAFRNALIPIITTMGVIFALLLGGSVVTETVFAWPGLGRLIVDAINHRDFPIVQAGVFVFSVCFVMINFVIDLLYGVIDPRIKYE